MTGSHEPGPSAPQKLGPTDAVTGPPPGADSDARSPAPPVVFFDGECGLCNRSVRWLMKRDSARILQFAPLQGEVAQRALGAAHRRRAERPAANEAVAVRAGGADQEESIVLWDNAGIHRESDAVLRAAAAVGGIWRLAAWLLLVPRVIRDRTYRWVARNRTRWFGRVESCALLSAEERGRLLP